MSESPSPEASLRGIFVPNVVPLDDRGRINEPELRRYTEWLIERGVQGLYPNGSTGEFLRYTTEERRRVVAIQHEVAAGRVPILAGASEHDIRATLDSCGYYHELGVRAVAVVAPTYFNLSPGSVYRYYAELARQTPIDLTLYNIPQFASTIDLATVVRLAEEFPRVIGIKDSSGDLPHMMRMLKAVRAKRPAFVFLTGWDTGAAAMFLAGCDGGTHATAGIAPEAMRRLFDLCEQSRWPEAMCLQFALLELFDAIIAAGDFPEGFRQAARLRGFDFGPSRQPAAPIEPGAWERIERALRAALAMSDMG